MDTTDELVLDYLTMRRRIERRASGLRPLLLHIVVFIMAVTIALFFYTNVYPPAIRVNGNFVPLRETLVPTEVGVAFTLWALALLIPGLLAYRKSRRRPQTIETELAERVQRGDTELLNSPRRLFRVQTLLDDDLRQRGAILLPLLVSLLVNAIGWVLWMIDGAGTSATWQLVPMVSAVTILPALLIHAWNRRRRERRILRQIAGWDSMPPEKTKRHQNDTDDDDRAYRLSDDGELMEDDIGGMKAKRA